MERSRSGDHDAFRILVERYQGRVFRLALRVLRDEEAARDAVQDAFLKVHGALSKFEGRSSFYTWLYRLVLNLCLDIKRRDRSSRHVPWTEERDEASGRPAAYAAGGSGVAGAAGAGGGRDDEAGSDPTGLAAPRMPGPREAAERGELREAIARAVDQLPDDAKRTLLLREVDGLSYAEIAKALGVPKGTVMSRLHYARRRVQELLLAEGVAPAGRRPAEQSDAGRDRGRGRKRAARSGGPKAGAGSGAQQGSKTGRKEQPG